MEIVTYQIKNMLWICLPEELDQYAADIIKRKCEIILMDQKRKHIVFDFSATAFMDSAGIGMLFGKYRQQQLRGGQLFVYRPGKRIIHLLEITGLIHLVNICMREEEINKKLEEIQ
ncbi:MAG: STAS domain-containing protein [Lachnospiraceae bacterium]|nr:STAS domain-containing protein [Lachnospiraceae bacterium]